MVPLISPPRLRSLLPFTTAAVGILLGAWLLRLLNLLSMPLFGDEALHILRAHRIAAGDLFEGIERGKWLYTAILATFRPLGSEGSFIARWLSALCGVVTTAACVGLARRFGPSVGGLLSGAIYALLPMAVFVERQALVDPMLTAFATLAGLRLSTMPGSPAP